MADLLCVRAFFIISDISIPPPPPPPFGLGGGALACFPGFIVDALTCLGTGLRLLLGGRVFEVIEVAAERVGMGGAGGACGLWAGLVKDGMGVVGRGGGEVGMSLKGPSGKSS